MVEQQVDTQSPQILVQVEANDGFFVTVGAIRDLGVVQERQFDIRDRRDENGILAKELIPAGPSIITLNVSRIVFDALSLPEAFGQNGVICKINKPFRIKVISTSIHTHTAVEQKYETTTIYNNCWFSRVGIQVNSENIVIYEDATILAENMSITKQQIKYGDK